MTEQLTESRDGQFIRNAVETFRAMGYRIVVVSGSREWGEPGKVRARLEALPLKTLMIHGNAPGLDRMAAKVAQRLGLHVLAVPAEWDRHGKKAGVLRNQAMIDLKPDVVLAWPLEGGRGTQDCMERARRAGIPVEELS